MRCARWSLTILVASLSGCFATDPTINRWATATGMPAPKPPILYVSSAAPPPSPSDPATFRSLADRTGAAYVQALAGKSKDAGEFSAALQKPFKDKSDSGSVDATKFPRVMLLSVQRSAVRPGDRLLSTTIDIQPIGFRFSDYSLAATERAAVNIGTIAVTHQLGENIGIAPGGGSAVTTGVSAGLSASQSETGTRNVASNTEFSVHVAPDLIEVFRTGADGQDLTGNTLIKLALRLAEDETKEFTVVTAHLTGDDGKVLQPQKVKLDVGTVSLNPATDLYVCAKLSYQDRVINKGSESYDEGKQDVALSQGTTPWQRYLVAPVEEMETPLWEIRVGPAGLVFDDGIRTQPVNFVDYDDAMTFMSYLQRFKQATLGNGQLLQGTKDDSHAIASFANLSLVRVPQTRAAQTTVSCPAEKQKPL